MAKDKEVPSKERVKHLSLYLPSTARMAVAVPIPTISDIAVQAA